MEAVQVACLGVLVLLAAGQVDGRFAVLGLRGLLDAGELRP